MKFSGGGWVRSKHFFHLKYRPKKQKNMPGEMNSWHAQEKETTEKSDTLSNLNLNIWE